MARKQTPQKTTRSRRSTPKRQKPKSTYSKFKALPFRKKLAPIGIAALGLLVLLGLGTFAYQTINQSTVASTCVSQKFRRGNRSTCVRHIQTIVNASAVTSKLAVDGSFGPATEAAVKAFQKNRRITIDGIVGPATWGQLCKVSGATAAQRSAGCSGTTTTTTTTTSSSWAKPTSGSITSNFGQRNGRLHAGVDIANKTGTPIYAASAGKVSTRNNPKGCGQVIEITHSSSLKTKYCHLNVYRVKAGATVKAGQRIGDMGNTGVSSGPHLHFEVIQNGKAIDPVPFMRAKGIKL